MLYYEEIVESLSSKHYPQSGYKLKEIESIRDCNFTPWLENSNHSGHIIPEKQGCFMTLLLILYDFIIHSLSKFENYSSFLSIEKVQYPIIYFW